MSRTYCEKCGKLCEYTLGDITMDCISIDNVSFGAYQKHAYCKVCGEEVDPAEISEFNITEAHDAYREAIGSISVRNIQRLLDMYNISKGPLSRLLGWGINTIARQMEHSIPDKEHAARLLSLFNPYNMRELLVKNGSVLTAVARRKATEATETLIQKANSKMYQRALYEDLLMNVMVAASSTWYTIFQSVRKTETFLPENQDVCENEELYIEAA